ncbi:uncharacterized serine-rich protein C215.13 [Galendromus occidentalis]|uniref:Uncharacterized serine-rich protein C215.13 n=1 Tax=Galendromus occidentalis TaxID=34638 RepID=A0AAJ6QSU7_9ACAR|nr:uncharacterized serine-rich protein C215.13 [Galendromus occidentalis]
MALASDVVSDVGGEELLEMRVASADRDSPSELSSSLSESEEDEVVASCREFYRRRLSSKWIIRPQEEDGNLTESESSDNPESIHATKCHIESDHDSGVEVLNRASSNSSVEESGRSQCVSEEDSSNRESHKRTEDTPVLIQCHDGSSNVQSDGTACRFEQLQIRRSSLLDEMDATTSKFASKMNFLKTQIGSLVEKDNQLFRQLLNLYDSISDLRKSQIFVPSTPSDMVIPEHYSYFTMSRSSSFSSSSSSSSSSESDTTVSPASSAASTPVSTPSWTPISSPSAMSTSSSSRSSYSVKQRSTCCRRCSAYSQRKCRQLPSNSSLSRKKRSFSISNISSGSDSGFELKLHSESDHEIFV